ncbi:MAG TPA: hypothetical protein VJU77_10075 [Chthoniobacterales bacterium]|nr:hypothetical protein [Chthoniobacterales bacterium]
MKSKIIAFALALAFFLPGLAKAKTLKFPKDDPEFSVTFTNNWKAEITSAGIISAQPKGAGYALSIFPVASKNARDAIDETAQEVEKRFTNIKPDEPVEYKNANNITFLERDMTGKDKGEARALAIVAFSPGGKSFYALFQASTPEADKKYTQDVIAIVKSITSLKKSSNDDDE